MPDVVVGRVAGGSGSLRGYLARPDGDGPWPGVVVLHEAFGLNDIVRRQADRLAAAGYLALAPDLYSDGGGPRCLTATFRAMYTGRGKAVADVDAAREYLAAADGCTGRIGIIGFCMGGGFALVTANRGFAAAAANYGPPPRDLKRALAGACPVVGSYGGRDLMLPGAGGRVRRALDGLGIENDVKEYPGVGHSFLNDRYLGPGPAQSVQRIAGVGPAPDAAADAWQRIEEFFARHLHD